MEGAQDIEIASGWDRRYARTVILSIAVHAVVIAALLWIAAGRGARLLPPVAYSVELTDPSALGGQLPPGARGPDLAGAGRPQKPLAPPTPAPAVGVAPKPKPAPVEAKRPPEPAKPKAIEAKPKAVEAKPEVPPAKPKAVEAKPEVPPAKPKAVEAKPKVPPAKPAAAEAKPKPTPPPAVEAAKPKAVPPKTTPQEPEAAADAKPAAQAAPAAAAKPAAPAEPQAAAGAPAAEAPAKDAYAALAERWKERTGGGLGGRDAGTGPIGTGGGPGGGGQVVGIEFLAYRQQVVDAVKARWANVMTHSGLVAVVRFGIGPDGRVSGVQLVQTSGNAAYDGSALRAVRLADPLPPPPERYRAEFAEFQMEFHPEEMSGGRP